MKGHSSDWEQVNGCSKLKPYNVTGGTVLFKVDNRPKCISEEDIRLIPSHPNRTFTL